MPGATNHTPEEAADQAAAQAQPSATEQAAHFPPLGWHDYPSSPIPTPTSTPAAAPSAGPTEYSLVPPPEPEPTQAFSLADLQAATTPPVPEPESTQAFSLADLQDATTPEPAVPGAAPAAAPPSTVPPAVPPVTPPVVAPDAPTALLTAGTATWANAPRTTPASEAPANFDDAIAPPVAPHVPVAAAASTITESSTGNSGRDAAEPGFFVKHRRVLIPTALAVAFVLLGTGAVFAGISAGSSAQGEGTSGGGSAAEAARAVPDTIPAATDIRTCTIRTAVGDDALGTAAVSVLNLKGGGALYDRAASDPQSPGTAMQAVTAAAALAELGPDYTLTTKVLDNNTPGSIVLVGGGDATLSQTPYKEGSVYKGAPKLSTLAAATLKSYKAAHPDVPITELVLDSSYWDSTDRWDPSWDRSAQTGGQLSEVTALQVDGDRDDPKVQDSPRSTDPITRAGTAFIAALGLEGVAVREGVAENGAPTLAEAKSAPVKTLVSQMLTQRDRTLAEMLARTVSKKANLDGTSASLQQAIPAAIEKLDLKTEGLVVTDGSGTSANDAVSPRFLANLMSKANSDDALAPLLDGLSVAGQTGDLSDGFTGDNDAAVGQVSAVTGEGTTGSSLSGVMTAKDKSRLSFSLFATGDAATASPEAATTALQSLATKIWRCGANLSKN